LFQADVINASSGPIAAATTQQQLQQQFAGGGKQQKDDERKNEECENDARAASRRLVGAVYARWTLVQSSLKNRQRRPFRSQKYFTVRHRRAAAESNESHESRMQRNSTCGYVVPTFPSQAENFLGLICTPIIPTS